MSRFWTYENKDSYNRRKSNQFSSEANQALFNELVRQEARRRGINPDLLQLSPTMFDSVNTESKSRGHSPFNVLGDVISGATGAVKDVAGGVGSVVGEVGGQMFKQGSIGLNKLLGEEPPSSEVMSRNVERFKSGTKAGYEKILFNPSLSPMDIPGVEGQIDKLPGPAAKFTGTLLSSINPMTVLTPEASALLHLGIVPWGNLAKSIVGASLGTVAGGELAGGKGELAGGLVGGLVGFGRPTKLADAISHSTLTDELTGELKAPKLFMKERTQEHLGSLGTGSNLGVLAQHELFKPYEVFAVDASDNITKGVTPTAAYIKSAAKSGTGPNLNFTAVMENPSRYTWTTEAAAARDAHYKIIADTVTQLKAANVPLAGKIKTEMYWPRMALDEMGQPMEASTKIGAKQPFQIARRVRGEPGMVETKYLANGPENIRMFVEQANRAIADKVLLDSLKDYKMASTLGDVAAGQSVKQKALDYAAAVASGDETQIKKTKEILSLAQKEMRASNKEATKLADKAYSGAEEDMYGGLRMKPGLPTDMLKVAGNINALLIPLQAAVDVSFTALQTASTFGSNPAGWVRMARVVLASALNPDAYYKDFADNIDVYKRLVSYGFRLKGTEMSFESALRGPYGKAVQGFLKSPLGKPFKVGNDLWDRAINVAAKENLLHAEAMMNETSPNIMKRLITRNFGKVAEAENPMEGIVKGISHSLGQLTIEETAKQGPTQRALLKALPFAGNYLKSYGNLIGDAYASGGLTGGTARRMIAGWAATGIGLYSLMAWTAQQAGLTNEAPNLDPFDPSKFLTLKVAGTRVGIGGPLQQALVASARLSKDPQNAPSIIARLARSKSSPVVGLAIDLFNQQTYTGQPLDTPGQMLSYLTTRVLPFAAQEPTRAAMAGNPQGIYTEAKAGIGSLFGLRSWSVSPRDMLAQEKFGKDWKELEPAQQSQLKQSNPEIVSTQGALGEKAQIGQRYQQYQASLDALFPPGPGWRDQYKNLMERKAGEYQQWEATHPELAGGQVPANANEYALSQYYKAFDAAKTAWGELDIDALTTQLNALEQSWSADQKAYVDRNTGQSGSGTVQAYKAAQKVLKPYWEIANQVWDKLSAKNTDASQYISLESYQSALTRAMQQAGMTDEQIAERLAKSPLIKQVTDGVSSLRKQYRKTHPEVDQLLTTWYGNTPVSASSHSTSIGPDVSIKGMPKSLAKSY